MPNKEIERFADGFRLFREKYFTGESPVYSKLSQGQAPKTLVIGCSDSRVDPAIISSAAPGELFVIRNVANLVPPYESNLQSYHGVSAAIEFAVVNLKVENVVIMGHRQCGGIRALVQGLNNLQNSFVGQWMKIAENARASVFEKHKTDDIDLLCKHCEMESIITSIEHLKTFPFVNEALAQKTLSLHGVYFDLEQGTLFSLDAAVKKFKQIV